MTISTAHPEVTSRTAAATAAKMRKSEERWASHLRGRGWTVLDPAAAAGLREFGPDHPDHPEDHECGWCQGYRAAVGDVLGQTDAVG